MLLIGLVIAAIVVPIIYKDEIVEKLKITLNDQLNAKVDFDDISLSILSSFPNARLDIENLSVTGIDQFADIALYKSKHTMLDVSIPSLINDDVPYQLREVILDEAEITMMLSQDGTANYSIAKETEEKVESSASYTLDLDKYELRNSKITYVDRSTNLKMVLDELNHSGKGRFTESIYDLDTYSEVGSMTMTSEGVNYMRNAQAKLDAVINIDVPNEKYTLKDNKISINELNLDADAFVQMKGDNIYVDATIKGLENNFRSYLSVVPHAYVNQFSNVDTRGEGSLTALIKGNYNSIKASFPSIDLDFNISDAYVKYYNMPKAVESIFASIQVNAKEGNYDDLVINIPSLKAKVGDDPIEAKLMISDSSTDPSVDGAFKADVDLRNWKSALPAEMISDMEGKIKADISFAGKTSDIEASNYSNLKLNGEMAINQLKIKQENDLDIELDKGIIKASPSLLDIEMTGVKYGKSDFELSSTVKDPLMLAINTNEPIISDIKIKAGTFDANEMLGTTATETESTESPSAGSIFNVADSKVNLHASADQIIYEDQTWRNVNLKGKLDGDKIDITDASALMKDNDINMTGTLNHPVGYLDGTETLTGKIDINSNQLNFNDFIPETEATTETEAANFLVPENVDVNITAKIKDLTYTNMNMVNSVANIEVNDQVANITSLTTNTLGGNIGMQGIYSSKDTNKPVFDMMLDFNKIEFVKAFEKMETMQKLAPIAQYISGFFNSTLTFKGALGEDMLPDISTLGASGFLETINSSVKDFKILEGLGNKLKIDELKSLTLENTKNWFEIVDGTVELKPKKFKVKDIDIAIAGKHGFGSNMNYFVEMKVPREMLKQNVVTGLLDQGLSKVEAEAAKYGITIGKGDFINLEIGITGSMQSPKYSIKPVGYESGGIKQAVNDEINNQIKTVKDSVKTVIEATKVKVRDSVETVINEVKDSVKTVVNTKVNEVKDSVKTVIKNQIDSLAAGAGLDPLKDKVKDVIGTDTGKEVDKVKDKIKGWNPFGKKKKNNE